MADSSAFAENTTFRASLQAQTAQGTAYGSVTFAFDRSDYPDTHPVDTADIADALRDFLESRGYTVSQFTAPVTTQETLDWPQEA